MPAATDLHPSLKIALAKTVAVVVPSPASSLALEATYLTKEAPIFSNLSENSMLLATVTPSLVILGPPNYLDCQIQIIRQYSFRINLLSKFYCSMTTLRPLGPRVVWTASASLSQPISILALASKPKLSCLAEKKQGKFLERLLVDFKYEETADLANILSKIWGEKFLFIEVSFKFFI
jgi:hypothetical protein